MSGKKVLLLGGSSALVAYGCYSYMNSGKGKQPLSPSNEQTVAPEEKKERKYEAVRNHRKSSKFNLFKTVIFSEEAERWLNERNYILHASQAHSMSEQQIDSDIYFKKANKIDELVAEFINAYKSNHPEMFAIKGELQSKFKKFMSFIDRETNNLKQVDPVGYGKLMRHKNQMVKVIQKIH